MGLQECQCTGVESELCDVCCMTEGTCISTFTLAVSQAKFVLAEREREEVELVMGGQRGRIGWLQMSDGNAARMAIIIIDFDTHTQE